MSKLKHLVVLPLLAGVMALSTVATALLQPAMPVVLVVAVLVVFGASAVGWNGVYLAEVARQAPPGMASIATGGTLAFTFFGVVLGPPVFGAISEVFGSYRAGYAALAIFGTVRLDADAHAGHGGVEACELIFGHVVF